MKKLLTFAALLCSLLLAGPAKSVYADELTPNLELSNGGNTSKLTDTSHYTSVTFQSGDTITVTSSDGSAIHGIYISWDSPAVSWTLTTDSGDLACGADGFLHEYVALEQPTASLTIHIPQNSMRVDGIRIFGEGELPHDVQVWNPPCERADIMVVSSHSDDEILFFGGVLPTYSYLHDADIQVVYMCEFWTSTRVREHEKLDGLWEAGIRFYPVCGNFYDVYSETLKQAKQQYSYDKLTEYLVKQIRESQPQVIVTHDIFGEYGHGFHMLTCQALMSAVSLAAEEASYPDSAALYGVWDTPKTYLHILDVNPVTLDLRVPIEEDYAGRTALDILKAAYKKHVSQQYCWFYVSDEYEYSCAEFGLYRTLVGPDTTNDLLCNLKTYKVQAAEEAARLEAERIAEEERLAAEEAARIEAERLAEEKRLAEEEAARIEAERAAEEKRLAEEETARIEAELLEKERLTVEAAQLKEDHAAVFAASQELTKELEQANTRTTVFAVCAGICLVAAIVLFVLLVLSKRKQH
ncbi:MAG: PIG-L family deacetylase [Lachnospiraceae bacterium]|nr:PIG-L family deacetylase [Lachnospiraceae bacterium]